MHQPFFYRQDLRHNACPFKLGHHLGVYKHIHTISTPPQSLFIILFSSVQISWENARKMHINLFSLFPWSHTIQEKCIYMIYVTPIQASLWMKIFATLLLIWKSNQKKLFPKKNMMFHRLFFNDNLLITLLR